ELALERAGDALAAGSDESRTDEAVTRLAAEATGASASLLWRRGEAEAPALVASFGLADGAAGVEAAAGVAERALRGRSPVAVEEAEGLPLEAGVSATLQLGQPPVGALQLLFAPGRAARLGPARDLSARRRAPARGCGPRARRPARPRRRAPARARPRALPRARDARGRGRRRRRPPRRRPRGGRRGRDRGSDRTPA